MQNKRSFFRTLPKILLSGGCLLLVSGLLLSAFITPALAGNLSLQQATKAQQGSKAGSSASSSLVFASGCDCSCTNARAQVCNVGSGDMQSSVTWKLYFASSGNPLDGEVIDSGSLGPLKAGECTQLDHTPSKAGYYAYSVQQEDGASGPKVIYSNACNVSGSCYGGSTPTPTATKSGKPTRTPTLTETQVGNPTRTLTPTETQPGKPTHTLTPTKPQPGQPTRTRTLTPNPIIETVTPRPPLDFNLSFVCGYPSDDFLTWKVANNTDKEMDYEWRVDGSDEHGNGSLGANHAEYFFTSHSATRVQLFVDGKNVDNEESAPACKNDLALSYVCKGSTQDWYATNPNNFPVEFHWELESGESGSGTAEANAKILLTSTSPEAHRMRLTWTDDRPGDHVVTLSSSATCAEISTSTPTETNPPPRLTRTASPTATSTSRQTRTPGPTATFTPPRIEITLTVTPTKNPTATPTSTATQVTFATPTSTTTLIPPGPATLTPTITLTPPPLIIFTPTNTPSPTTTLVEPALTVTQTPILIPVTGADLTEIGLSARLQSFGGLLINTGLFLLGLALALAAFSGQLKG
jgi:YqxM protein